MRKLILVFLFIFGLSVQIYAWEATATFEGLTVGNVATGTNGFGFAATETKVSSTFNSGSRGVQLNWTIGNDGWTTCNGNLTWGGDVAQGGEVWYRAYVKYPSDWQWTDTFKKCMRIRINNNVGSSEGWISIILIDSGEIVLSNEVSSPQVSIESGINVGIDEWVCLEIYVYLHSADGTGIVRIWKNGILIAEHEDETLGASNSVAGESIFASSWNSPHSSQIQSEYADDFIMTNVQPNNQDAVGNYMIGPIGWGEDITGYINANGVFLTNSAGEILKPE
jgi:hypothetical protein